MTAKNARANKFLTASQYIKQNNSAPTRFNFAASQGSQGKHDTWVIQVPLHVLADFFEPDAATDPQWRSQRLVSKARAQKITSYIQSNAMDYVVPSLTATIVDDVPDLDLFPNLMANKFDFMTANYSQMPDAMCGSDPIFGQLSVLSIPTTSRFYFIDGQHRATGIQGLKLAASRAGISLEDMMPNDTVAVMCRMDTGLSDRQAQFSVINSTAAKTNGSLNALYAAKQAASGVVSRSVRHSFVIGDSASRWKIDYEKTACSGRSPFAFPFKTLVDSSYLILGVKADDEVSHAEEELLNAAWQSYLAIEDSWFRYRNLNASELREASILPHSVFIAGYADFCRRVATEFNEDIEGFKAALALGVQGLDFDRSNAVWVRACCVAGRLAKRKANVDAVSDVLFEQFKANCEVK